MYLQNQLFRTAGGGGFEALTQAVAKDGAMMVWLDTATDKKAHPNENFAREMMELFTLGIGNYTQADVTAAARAFTGWAYDRVDYRYVFRPRQHDFGSKTYLGQTGDWNGEDIVRIAVDPPGIGPLRAGQAVEPFRLPGASRPIRWSTTCCPRTARSRCRGRPAGHVPAPGVSRSRQAARRTGQAAHRVSRRRGPGPRPRRLAAAARTPATGSARGQARTAGAARRPPPATLPALATALGQTPFNPPNVGGWGQNGYWLDTATARAAPRRSPCSWPAAPT